MTGSKIQEPVEPQEGIGVLFKPDDVLLFAAFNGTGTQLSNVIVMDVFKERFDKIQSNQFIAVEFYKNSVPGYWRLKELATVPLTFEGNKNIVDAYEELSTESNFTHDFLTTIVSFALGNVEDFNKDLITWH